MSMNISEKNKILPWIGVLSLLFFFGNVTGQEDLESTKEVRETAALLSEANAELSADAFVEAEVKYRKAIAISPTEEIGKYNLGNAYYNEAKNDEAMRRYAQAAEVSESRTEKHRAFHNLGNTFMNAKKYQEAVEAYKSALRNDPTDDESRYNLALAKDMLDKNPPQDEEGEDDNKDQKENEDENKDNKEDQKDKENDDEGKDKEGDEGDEKEEKDQGDEKDKNKEGEDKDEKEKEDPNKPKEGEGEQPKQPVPGQLSPQQIKNLLQAMNDEEKKVQEKINAKKHKGAAVKTTKDW